jgi:hypothetical protein
MQEDGTTSVAVWVDSIGDASQAYFHNGYICDKSADVRASSSDRKFTMQLQTNALSEELLEKFKQFLRHGFTVIEIPDHWVSEYSRPPQWRETFTNQALNRVMQLKDDIDGERKLTMYDEAQANEVLTILAPKYPHTVNMIDIKRSLAHEPSDDELLTTLQGLHIEGLITGDAIPDRMSGKRKLAAMMKIRITKEGRQHLSGSTEASVAQPHPVIHQYNNYGQSGAMGPHSVGSIHYQQQWAASANQVDLSQLISELQALRTELMKTAKTPADFQQLGLVAEAEQYAEKQDGPKVMEVLSKTGKGLLDFAKDVGTEITAKLLAKSMGLEP